MDYEKALAEANDLVTQAIPLLVRDPASGAKLPDYARVDTTNLDLEEARVDASRRNANTTIGDERTNISNATKEEKAAIAARAVADQELTFADKAKADRDAALFAQYANIFGLNPDDVAGIVHKMNVERPKAEMALREIQGMSAVGPTDNILEWWSNQFKLPSKISAYNRQADLINSMEEIINSNVDMANKTASFVHKGLPTITAAQAKAKADAIAADAAKDAAKKDIEFGKINVDFATKAFATDLAAAQMTLHTTQLEVQQHAQEIQLAIQKIQFADNHANRLLRAGDLLEKLAKNEDEMAQRRVIGKVLERFDTVMGHPIGTTNYIMWRNLKEEQRQNMLAIGAGSLGATPVAGMANYYRANPGPLTSPETSRLMKYILDKSQEVSVSPQVQMLDEKQKIDKINKVIDDQIKQDIANASKMGGLFYELSPAKMIAAAQIAKDSVVAKSLEPLTKQDNNIPTELIIATIAQTFNNPNDASQAVADYYKRNMALRNSTMNTGLVGIQLPNEYKVKVPIGSMSSALLDMTKSEDVLKYLLIKKERHAIDTMLGATGMNKALMERNSFDKNPAPLNKAQ